MERFQKSGLPENVSWSLLHSPYIEQFEKALALYPKRADFLAQMVLNYIPEEVKRNGNIGNNEQIGEFLKFIAQKNLEKENAIALLRGKKAEQSWEQTLANIKIADFSDEQIDLVLKEVLTKFNGQKVKEDLIIGEVKRKLNGSVSGKRIHHRLVVSSS
jgi:hypothetical protein